MLQNYTQLIERIAKSSRLSVEDIERRIEAKRAKLSGLISKEGAAQIVASELGINFEKEKMKVSELLPGMKKVNIVGKIISIFPIREYNKEGREGKIGSFLLADETSNVRTVLWDTNHISLIEKGSIKEGDVIDIANGSFRNNEIHLTGFSDIKLSSERLEKVVSSRVFFEKKISEAKEGESINFRAFVVQLFEPRYFTVCPACGKKLGDNGECLEHGKVSGEKRALLSLVLDDGSETTRAVLFSDQISKIIPKEDLENNFVKKREEILGKEMIFTGQVRRNKIFDNLEFFVSDVRELNVDSLIEQLEKQ